MAENGGSEEDLGKMPRSAELEDPQNGNAYDDRSSNPYLPVVDFLLSRNAKLMLRTRRDDARVGGIVLAPRDRISVVRALEH